MIMTTGTSDYRDICLVRFVAVLLIFSLENSEQQTFQTAFFASIQIKTHIIFEVMSFDDFLRDSIAAKVLMYLNNLYK